MQESVQDRKLLVAGVFDRAATGYGRLPYFPRFGDRLVELARIPAGAQVLDVATGRGALLIPAARRAGPKGRVIGVDLSAQMVRETLAEVRRQKLSNVRVLRMDAERLDIPASTIDVLLCGFALFFFPRLDQALAEFRRALKPGGRLAVSTWGDDDPRWAWYGELIDAYGARVKLRSHELKRADEVRSVLERAGFTDVSVSTEETEFVWAGEDEWWDGQWAITLRAGLERMSPAVLEKFKAEALDKLRLRRQPDGFHDRAQVHFGLAVNPGRPPLVV